MLLKKNKKNILILIGIAAILTTGIAFAANGGLRDLFPNLSLDKDFSDIIESPRQMTSPFNMTELPEYFNASVVVKGSGYTGQPHTVYIMISHTRPDSSVWLAAGDYSLTLESGGEVLEYIIASGQFSNLRNTVPFKSQDFPWTPEITAGTMYNLVLNLDKLVWTMATEYTITVSAGTGGSIKPGTGTYLKGADQLFTITPDEGYAIEELTVNGSSVGISSTFTIGSIDRNYTIHATFISTMITMRTQFDNATTAYVLVEDTGQLNLTNMTFDGLTINEYVAGVDFVEFNFTLENLGLDSITGFNYVIDYMYLNGTGNVLALDPAFKVNLNFSPGEYLTISRTFTAPSIVGEEYTIEITITDIGKE